MLRVAVTGGIACGKSLVGRFLSEEGIPVCDADDLAHDLMGSGTDVSRRVAEVFGAGVIAPDGSINRSELGRMVFGDDSKLASLNSIVHPEVRRLWNSWLADVGAEHKVAIVIIPLLYEIGDDHNWDAVICVAAPEDDQKRRLLARGLSECDAAKRLSAQMSVLEKMERADYVVYNTGTVELLEKQTGRVVGQLLETQHGGE